MCASRRRQPVVLRAPVVLRCSPEARDEALVFEAVERRVQRPVLHLEHLFGGVLDRVGDGVAVRRSEEERAQDEHVERSREDVAAIRILFPSSHTRTLLHKKF